MTDTSLIAIIQKHLHYRRSDEEFYLSRDDLAVLKGEIMAYEVRRQHEAEQPPDLVERVAKAIKAAGYIPWCDSRSDEQVRTEQAKAAIAAMPPSEISNKDVEIIKALFQTIRCKLERRFQVSDYLADGGDRDDVRHVRLVVSDMCQEVMAHVREIHALADRGEQLACSLPKRIGVEGQPA